MEFFETVIYQMYEMTLLEYLFYCIDGIIGIACLITFFIASFKLHRRFNNKNTRLLYFSCIAMVLSIVISTIVLETGYEDKEHLSLFELVLVYLPGLVTLFVTIGIWRIFKGIKEI